MKRICSCGCGRSFESQSNAAKYFATECRRKRTNRDRRKRAAGTALSAGEVTVHPVRLNTDPAHKPSKVCRVCFNLPERRDDLCAGCGQPWAAERAVTGRIVLRSSSGLALAG